MLLPRPQRWGSEFDTPEAQALRDRMVDAQIAARGIHDGRVLDAFRRLPRHVFCPPGTALADAYGDHPLPIGHGQTISQPFMVAEMTAMLCLTGTESVLEIGTGSGYQAALLGLLAATVHTVERLPELAATAAARLRELGLGNIHCHTGDGTEGWRAQASYDRIIVTAAAPAVPEPLAEQLAEGGTLIVPVGPRHVQQLAVVSRRGNKLSTTHAEHCRFVPLIGQHGWEN